MNAELARLLVLPLYGQVSIQGSETRDLPEWVTGEESILSTDDAIVIATRPDVGGDVVMTVVEGADAGNGELIYDAELSVPSGVLEFGSIVAGSLGTISLANEGRLHFRVYVDTPGAAEFVEIVLDPGTSSVRSGYGGAR